MPTLLRLELFFAFFFEFLNNKIKNKNIKADNCNYIEHTISGNQLQGSFPFVPPPERYALPSYRARVIP